MTENRFEGEDLLLLDRQLCFPLYSAANATVRAYRPFLNELDITYLQYIVLMVLWEERQVNVKTLGERLHLDSGTLTPLLKRLAAKGLVKRTRSEEDERVRLITLTDEGMQLKQQAAHIPHCMKDTINLTIDEMIQLKALCEKAMQPKHAT